jgi:hypothetical protein
MKLRRLRYSGGTRWMTRRNVRIGRRIFVAVKLAGPFHLVWPYRMRIPF